MSITRYAIDNNRVTLIVLLVIVMSGYSAFMNLPQSEDPGFTIRWATVMTYYQGASPERIEMLVTDKLEKKIQEIPEVNFITSQSRNGFSYITVEVKESYTDMRPIWDTLRRKVEDAKADLPPDVDGPYVNDEFGDVFGHIITITGEGYDYAGMKKVADDVRDEILLIEEVAKVQILGAQEERIFMDYENATLARYGMSPSQIAGILQGTNIINPGGTILVGRERISLEPSGNFETLEDLKQTVIMLPDQSVIHLEDLVHVYRGYVEPVHAKLRANGQPALGLAISMREGGNITKLGKKLTDLIPRLEQVYPIGIEFEFLARQSQSVKEKVDEFVGNLLQSIGIVILVMIFTLGFRTGIVVATLIPMAILMALMFMEVFDIGLDQISLASLIIALGMLVDNAIVMSESIMVQIQSGKKPRDAAIDSAKELRLSLLTSSLTTCAAFLPIYLAESAIGEYCAPLFKVVSITLLSSWFLALTMTPLMCMLFLKYNREKQKTESYGNVFYRKYRNFLISLLKGRWVTVAVVFVVFIVAMAGFGKVPFVFMEENNRPLIIANLTLPVGTDIEVTTEMARALENFISSELMATEDQDGIENWATFIGEGAPMFVLGFMGEESSPHYAQFIINATSYEDVKQRLIPTIERYAIEHFPDVRAELDVLQMGPPISSPIAVRVSGRDMEQLFRIVDDVKEHLAGIEGAKNIHDDWGPRTKKLEVRIDQSRARRVGLSSQDIAMSLQTILSGYNVSQFREEDKLIPIMMRSDSSVRENIEKLETHNIFVQYTGTSVPLTQVADIAVKWEAAKILRRDRLKTVTVLADVTDPSLAMGINQMMDEYLAEESSGWQPGYRYAVGGDMEETAKANKSVTDKLPLAGFIIMMLLIAQFNSFRKPVIILVTILLGLIGVVIGLLLTGASFGFMPLLGVISLSGIVINNAIVLLDRIQVEIKEFGRNQRDAIIEAAQRRFRPIILTTVTTIGGLLPLWFAGGPLWEAMAITIIFGLLFATILTLGVVPTLYSIFYRVRFKDYSYNTEPEK